MLSFWEKESFTKYDYAVIGGGIVGLSTALSLREKSPLARIIVLERGLRPTGASSRNAGFACFGSLSEMLTDVDEMGEEAMVNLVKQRWEGLEKLRRRVGDENLQLENNGGYELLRDREMPLLDKISHVNSLLKPVFEKDVFSECGHKIKDMGFSKKTIKGLIYNPYESQLHAGEMMRTLWRLAGEHGIEILTGARVKRIEKGGNSVKLRIRGAMESDKMGIVAKRVAVCTNAFTKNLFPEVKLKPGRGLVLITEPIHGLPFKGTFHMDRGYFYFRNVGDRVLFGGGRNLQMSEEETTNFGVNKVIKETLKNYLKNILVPDYDVNIDYYWSGIMAFGENKKPVVRQISPGIFMGVRLGGMGVAIGSNIGEKLAEMMIGDASI